MCRDGITKTSLQYLPLIKGCVGMGFFPVLVQPLSTVRTRRCSLTSPSSSLTHHSSLIPLPLSLISHLHTTSLLPHPSPILPHLTYLTPPPSSLLLPPSPLLPHNSSLLPRPSSLTPPPIPLIPHPSPLIPHPYPLSLTSSLLPQCY